MTLATQAQREPLASDIRYGAIDMRLDGAKVAVVGYQVGVLAVRRVQAGTTLHLGASGSVLARPWLIEHWPSGLVASDAESFEDALRIADDLSIALDGLEMTDVDEFEDALEQRRSVLDWLDFIEVSGFVRLREWRAAQKGRAAA